MGVHDLNSKEGDITRPMDVLSFTEWRTVFVLMIEIMFIYLLENKINGAENCQEFHLNTCIQLRLLKHPPENS